MKLMFLIDLRVIDIRKTEKHFCVDKKLKYEETLIKNDFCLLVVESLTPTHSLVRLLVRNVQST